MEQKGDRVNRKGLDRFWWELSKLARIRFWYLLTKVDIRILTAIFVLIACSVSMVIMGVVAYLTSWPFIFPSLGPSTFLCFYSPSSSMAAPRNMVLGHGIGAVVGFGVYHLSTTLVPPSMSGPIWMFISPAVALGIAGMVMVLTGILHPPAASTTMIAAMGLMPNWYSVPVVVAAVSLIAFQAYIMHHLAGVKYPLWNPGKDFTPKITTILGNVVFEHAEEDKRKDPFAAVSSQIVSRRKVSSRKREREKRDEKEGSF